MHDLDLKLLRWMRTHGHTPGLEDAASPSARPATTASSGSCSAARWRSSTARAGKSWLICALLGPIAIGLNYGIKLLVKRPRPVLEGLPPLGGAPSSLSFPSAHATSSFAVATAMVRVDPAMAGAFVVAFALALGRPYLGMHYPSDVLAGAFIGVALGLIVPLSF